MDGASVIGAVLSRLGISASALAARSGVKYHRIVDIQRGRTKALSLAVAKKIHAQYPEFNFQWLLTGEGEMLVPSPHSQTAEVVITGDGNNSTVRQISSSHVEDGGDEVSRLIEIIRVKDEQIAKKDQQIDSLIALLMANKTK